MLITYSKEVPGVLVTVSNPNAPAEYLYVLADSEVSGKEGLVRAVVLEDHGALEEGTLGRATVHLLGLDDHDGVVLQVVQHYQLPNLKVLQSALNHTLLKETVKSQHLKNS